MGHYDTMQVCMNGHKITGSYNEYPQHRKDYCGECGAKTVTECQECGHRIKGRYNVEGVISGADDSEPPPHCENCGVAMPWKGQMENEVKDKEGEYDSGDHSSTEIKYVTNVHGDVKNMMKGQVNEQKVIDSFDEIKNEARKRGQDQIIEQLEKLQEELNSDEVDKNRVGEITDSLEENAAWAVPLVTNVTMKLMGL